MVMLADGCILQVQGMQLMQKHILTVDDEPYICELLRETLTGRGYRVTSVAGARQANSIAKADPPQLIIMDYQLQSGDGFGLIDEMRKLAPTAPILLLTGVIFEGQAVRDLIQKKVTSYLDKTTSLRTIVREIQRLLGDPQDALVSA
jgi:DNA-binding NtrC family response regulator